MQKLVTVATPSPLRKQFDYLWPEGWPAPRPGERVLVPFGNRRVVGLVTAIRRHSDVDAGKLKAVAQRLDDGQPAISKDLLDLAQWSARYYHHPLGECLQQMLPVLLRRAETPKATAPTAWRLNPEIADLPPLSKRAHQQQALLAAVTEHGQLSKRQIKAMGYTGDTLNKLIRGKYVQACIPIPPPPPTADRPLTLNEEQHRAVQAVVGGLGAFNRFLLEGVTGSGKTEVYLQVIAECLQRGDQALVLIPEIGLTPQTLARFERRFPGQVSALHSGLSDSERLNNWQAIRTGERQIVLGTRSAVLSDFARLGVIIVDEEHDPSYKQQDGWHYSARDIAVKRAADWQCPVLLASATPSLDSLYNTQAGRYQHLKLVNRAGQAQAPTLRLLDIRQQTLEQGLSPLVIDQLSDNLRQGNQSLVFLNRRGFAPLLQCHTCGWMADCDACDARMTVHFRRRELRCHHCDARKALPSHCPQCGNASLIYDGPGTERLELALQQHFPEAPVIRIDRDTTSNKGSMTNLLTDIQQGAPGILVGTQMLAKGHHFPDVTLVAVVDIDGGLFSPDFRAAERCGQLLLQVAGRAGRGDKPGTVLIQTHCPEHPVLLDLVQRGYSEFAQALLGERKLLNLPPCGYMAVMRCDARQLDQAMQFLQQVSHHANGAVPGCDVIGPLPAAMARRAGRYRASIIFQSSQRQRLHQALDLAIAQGERQRRKADLRWSVDVDPLEVF